MATTQDTPQASRVSELDSGPNPTIAPGGFELKFHWRILGSHAPIFPGFEIDICDRVSESEKPDAIWHRERARGLLRDHPEVKKLFGRSSWTAVCCLVVAGVHLSIALMAAKISFWLLIPLAYTFGVFANIGMFNLAHECNHALVFKKKKWNRWLFTGTSMLMMLPAHHTWWIEHHVHHNELGAKQDFVKRRRSILLYMKDRLFGHPMGTHLKKWLGWATTPLFWPIAFFVMLMQLLRSLVGLFTYIVCDLTRLKIKPSDRTLAILADEHLVSGYKKYGIETWAVTYPIFSLVTISVLWIFFGWQALAYLFTSALFMTGFLHPLAFGLLLSNSHFHGFSTYQPTSSYYGWLNFLTFNFGLHTEHHDLASIPWHNLGKLKKIAPEYYEPLKKTESFTGLAMKFVFGDREEFNNEEYRNKEMLGHS